MMAARTFRSRTPRPEREPPKEKEKTGKLSLKEHCKVMKQQLIDERMEENRRIRQEEMRPAEEEIMRMIYGPNWKQTG